MPFSVIIHNELVSCLHCILLGVVVFLKRGACWRGSPGTPSVLVVCLSEWGSRYSQSSGSCEGGRLLPQALCPVVVRLHFTPVTSLRLRLF